AMPAHPTDVYPRAPRPLGDVALQLLEKEWRKRPVNASAVLGLLGPAAEGSDVFGRIPERRPPPVPRQTTWDGAETRRATPGVKARRQTAAASGRQSARFRTAELAAFATLVMLLLVGLLIHDRRMHARDEAMAAAEASARQEKLAAAASQCVEFRGADPAAGITPAAVYGADGALKWSSLALLGEWNIPKYPIEKQLRAPCPKGVTEINGGCWTAKWSLLEGDTCPEGYFRHGNECYMPVRDPKYPLPTRDPTKPTTERWEEWNPKPAR
ncbi:MAG TPA: hypothetical protein VK447_09695, partial [Myxococcaceae bacterium]|nr:hypothetical protein [Myxococcaceae bacterium]